MERTGRAPEMGRSAETRAKGAQIEGRSAFVHLDHQSQSRVRETIIQQHVQPASNVDFDVSVGTVVPDTVRFYDLPPAVVDIVPQYRGFQYFLVRDEIIIVNPDTDEIVAILPA